MQRNKCFKLFYIKFNQLFLLNYPLDQTCPDIFESQPPFVTTPPNHFHPTLVKGIWVSLCMREPAMEDQMCKKLFEKYAYEVFFQKKHYH